MATDSLLGAAEIRRIADRLGLRPTKKLGQNFVHDANTVRKIVQVAGVAEGEHVLEVGPGIGSLTLGLLETGARVTAVEIDHRLAGALPETIRAHRGPAPLTVVHADALTLSEIPDDASVLVANLPYNTAVPIVLHLLGIAPQLRRVVVMVQAEVARRLAAPPGTKDYGSPSVKARWYGRWQVAAPVSRQVFWPVPHVDSLLVAMEHTPPPGDEELRRVVWRLVEQAFHTRRKMARGALAPMLGEATSNLIEAAGLDPEDRGEAWSLEDYVALAQIVRSAG